MSKYFKYLLLPLILVIIAIILYYQFKKEDAVDVSSCPDEMIVNRMPSVGGPNSSYYIKDGERKELSDYDQDWVKGNCTVPTQTVY